MIVEIQKSVRDSIILVYICNIIDEALKGKTIEETYSKIQSLKFNKKLLIVGRGGSHIFIKNRHNKQILFIH